MSEDIELASFQPATEYNEIEEYHEIKYDNFDESTLPLSFTKSINEHEFFTQHDVKTGRTRAVKKKKGKKKETSSNLMDIISSELAAANVPLEENVISVIDYTVEQKSSYLETVPRTQKIFQRRISQFDSEQGWGRHEPVTLNPTFPKVLENVTSEETTIPIQYIKPVKYDEVIANFENEEKQMMKFLDIEIKNLKFTHHHSFSIEKLLCLKLIELYKEYEEIKQSLKDIEKDVKIYRETRDNIKQEFLKISPNKKDDIRLDSTVREYTKNLLEVKEMHLKTMQMKKESVHKILSLWSDIEMVREKRKKTDTSKILKVAKDSLTDEDFEKEWNEIFKIEYNDMLDKVEYDYVSKYLEYKEVKYTQNLDDSTKKRISKPKLHIDEEVLKEEVEAIVNKIVTKDKIDIDLLENKEVQSNKYVGPENEYYFEIYVDDLFVCESDHYTSRADKIDDIVFSELFSVQILTKNSTLQVVLVENGKDVSTLIINLEDIRKNNISSEFVKQTFTYNELIEPNEEHVGSGHNIKEISSQNKVRLKSSNLFKDNLYTTCEVSIKMGWNGNLHQNQNETIKNCMEISSQIKRLLNGIDNPTTEALVDIIGKVYNRDISNEDTVLQTLNKLCRSEISTEDTFPVDENSPEFLRLKLLHLRNKGGMTSVENKMVPLHASQIPIEQLNCLKKTKDTDLDAQYYNDKYGDMEPIEIQRFIGAKYVQKLNKNMLRNLNEHLLRKTHKDVVRDFQDLSLRTLFSKQSKLTLANISSGAKQQILKEALGREQEIEITVLRAFNLPDRSVSLEDVEDQQIAGFKVRPLRPSVRCSYNGVAAQTGSAIGCHPSWSHTLKLTCRPEPLNSIHINVFDEHKCHIPDGSEDETRTVHYRYCSKWLGGLQVPLHTVLSLGSFRGTFKLTTPSMIFGYENPTETRESTQSLVPAVTQLMKKETSFIALHLTTSLSHLGGLHGYNQPIPNSEDDYLINHLNKFVTEYLNDFPSRNISLTFIDSTGRNKCVTQFLQPIPPPDYESFPKNPKMRSGSGVSKSSSSKSSGKKREDSGSYREERESLYGSMSWKSENQIEKIMCACARYVSLIPTCEVFESHTVTLLGLELLKVLHGSPLDHTLLLASYFLHLGLRCYVATGLGLPRGQSSFVLTKYDLATKRPVLQNDNPKSRGFLSKTDGCVWYVHDAVSGEKTELRDVGCPLKTVDLVFDNENIWVNVQTTVDCESVSFDFTKTSDWQPVLDKTLFVMKLPVLTDSSLYSTPMDVERLRSTLETKIKEKVQKWRPHTKTIWNRYCSTLLRETLPLWEYYTFNPFEPKPQLNQRLKQLMATFKTYGFPLNLPYVNTKSVLSTVKSTGVHCNPDPNVEFGLAVEVYAYPNNVFSVWVFLASISRL